MDPQRIGVDVDDFRLPIKEALPKAAELGFHSIEVGLTSPDLPLEALTASAVRHFVRFTKDQGLSLAALTADLPGLRLTDPARVEERVDRTRRVLDAAAAMRVPIVTAAVSALTHPDTGEASPHALEALRQIAMDADRRGAIYAIRPSADKPEHLVRIIHDVGSESLKICLDPAMMLMSGSEPTRLISTCPAQIVLSYARDAIAGRGERGGMETPLGEGEIDWLGHLMLLEAAGYHGLQILRRQSSQRPASDLAAGRDFLQRLAEP